MKHKKILYYMMPIIISVMGILLLLLYNNKPPSSLDVTIQLEPDNPQMVFLGKVIYAEQCASCHGVTLKGQKSWQYADKDGYLPAPPHDATGHTWHHSDKVLFILTKYGIEFFTKKPQQTRMPKFDKTLTDDEIIATLSYIKSTWSATIKAKHSTINKNSN